MSIMQRLKAETQLYHTALEEIPASQRLMSPAIDRAGYEFLLRKFYGFHAPLETTLSQQPDWELLNFDQRRKVPFLERDFQLLNLHPQQIPLCTHLPAVETPWQALGCLYVLEGATLGGQIITRHLKKHLDLPAFHFYGSYGEKVGVMWKSFGEIVNGVNPAYADEMVASASETFITLKAWLLA